MLPRIPTGTAARWWAAALAGLALLAACWSVWHVSRSPGPVRVPVHLDKATLLRTAVFDGPVTERRPPPEDGSKNPAQRPTVLSLPQGGQP